MSGHRPAAGDGAAPSSGFVGQRLIEGLAHVGAITGGLSLFAMAAVTTGSVISRALFDRPFSGGYELTELLTGIAVLAFFPYTHLKRHNITAEFFTAKAPPAVNRLLDALADVIFLAMTVFLVWRVGVGFLESLHSPVRSFVLGLPQWAFYAPAAAWLALWALTALSVALHSLGRIAR